MTEGATVMKKARNVISRTLWRCLLAASCGAPLLYAQAPQSPQKIPARTPTTNQPAGGDQPAFPILPRPTQPSSNAPSVQPPKATNPPPVVTSPPSPHVQPTTAATNPPAIVPTALFLSTQSNAEKGIA